MDQVLGQLGSLFFTALEDFRAFLLGLDPLTQLSLIGGLVLLLVVLRLRARLAATSGHRALCRQYRKLVKSGVAEWELPFRLLESREEWDHLPKEFLMELASRLEQRDRIIEFILLVEGDDFDREDFVRLMNYEPDTAMHELSVMLTDHAAELKAKPAIAALGLAIQIDPENHLAMIDLATRHYSSKHYAEALPLLEQAMSLSREARPQQAGSAQTLHDMLALLGEMHEDCVTRVGAAAA